MRQNWQMKHKWVMLSFRMLQIGVLSNNDVPIESLSGVTTCNAEHSEEECMSELSTQTPPRPMMSFDDFINDNEGMLFYTGLASHTDFHFVLHRLGPAAYHLRYLYNL